MNAPGNVQRRRLKYVTTINDEALGEETKADYELQYVDIGNVDSSGTVHEIATHRFADAPSRARRRVRDGDVIISCVRTYLQAITPIQNPPDNLIVSTGFAVVRPRAGVLDVGFCKYALREPAFLAEVEMRSVGVSYPAINASDLGDIPVHFPSAQSQRAIADYLDRETARLDALVEAKERVLGLLAEKRRALITRAVTRGLDPLVTLRASGVPWLGEIPSHWERAQLRRFTSFITSGSRGWAEHYSASGSLFVRIGNLTRDSTRLDLTDVQYVSPPDGSEGERTRIQPGDLLFSITAYLGSVAVAPGGVENAYVNQHIALVRLDIAKGLIPDFAAYAALSDIGQSQLAGQAYGGTKTQLALDDIRELWFLVPPLAEQQAVVAHIAVETAKLDAMRSATERTIALLKERRAALIAAAVTGQIDVGSGRHYTDTAASQKEPGRRR